MDIRIQPLTPALLPDYLHFFDHITFTENPEWSACYCYHFHFSGPVERWTRDNNRQAVSKLIKAGKHNGFLAYVGDHPIGWLNADVQTNYLVLPDQETDRDEKTGVLACFVIDPQYRRKGIASKLQSAAVDSFRRRNFNSVIAYPAKEPVTCERNYRGPLDMYRKSGFKIEKELEHLYMVRKSLK